MEPFPFLEDIFPENLMYASIIRSPIAKGTITGIEVPPLPEQFTLLTAKNIPGKNRLYDTKLPILAEEKLSYIGEPAALLIGPDKTKLENISALTIVKYEEETPIFKHGSPGEVSREIKTGNTQAAFEKTGRIVTGSFNTGIQDHWYAEPPGAVTWWKEIPEKNGNKNNGRKSKKNQSSIDNNYLVVRTSTQWPYHVKNSVSLALGMDASDIIVEPTALNLHMDGKLWYPSLMACLSALGTFVTKSPVRLILNRKDDFLFTPKRFASHIDFSSAIDEKGRITASEIDIFVNLGAHLVNENEILDQICLGSLGLYKFDNLRVTARAYKTNIPPQGTFSGFGLSQGLFAIERHVSQIADMLNIDPAQIRKETVEPKALLPSRINTTGDDLLDTAAKMSFYYRKWSSFEMLKQSRKGKPAEKGENPRGIGIAVGFQGSGLFHFGEDKGNYTVEVTLTKESTLVIKTSITSPENYKKIWQKTASEIISIQPEMIIIVTEDSPDCGPSCASRNITAVTKLVEKCCQAVKKQHFHEPLPITVRRSVKPQSGSIRYDDWNVMDINGFLKPALAAAVVEVAVDLVECVPIVRGVWLAVDGGKIISKHRAKRSLMRSVTQALGWSFIENIDYVNGKLSEDQYENFSIFSQVNTPNVEIEFLQTDESEAKGIGELPFTCIPAAFMQAVSQAMDHSFKSIPLKRKEIWEMLRIKNDETQPPSAKSPAKLPAQAVK